MCPNVFLILTNSNHPSKWSIPRKQCKHFNWNKQTRVSTRIQYLHISKGRVAYVHTHFRSRGRRISRVWLVKNMCPRLPKDNYEFEEFSTKLWHIIEQHFRAVHDQYEQIWSCDKLCESHWLWVTQFASNPNLYMLTINSSKMSLISYIYINLLNHRLFRPTLFL